MRDAINGKKKNCENSIKIKEVKNCVYQQFRLLQALLVVSRVHPFDPAAVPYPGPAAVQTAVAAAVPPHLLEVEAEEGHLLLLVELVGEQ